MGIIYKITNNVNQKVYIGQTTNPLEYRWQQHKYNAKDKNRNFSLYLAMRKYGVENFKIEQIDECPNSLLDKKEREWIEFYNSYECGYNMTPGGDGGIKEIDIEYIFNLWKEGYGTSEISEKTGYHRKTVSRHLQQLSEYSLEEANERGKRGSIKAKQKKVFVYNLKELYKEFSTTEEAANFFNITPRILRMKCHEKKYSNFLFFSYEPLTLKDRLEILKKQNKTPISQFDLEGNLINIYGCITEAQKKNKCNNIIKGIKEKMIIGGFQWREYNPEVTKIEKYQSKNKRRVQQYSLDGKLIKTFDSLREAAKEVGAANTSGITIACQNPNRTAKGFKWKYE